MLAAVIDVGADVKRESVPNTVQGYQQFSNLKPLLPPCGFERVQQTFAAL